jgi:hypothetical protein
MLFFQKLIIILTGRKSFFGPGEIPMVYEDLSLMIYENGEPMIYELII